MTGTEQQLSTFGWMVATGVGVGLIFDLYRLSRGLLRPRWLATALGDLTFWFIVAGLTYGVLLQVNWGEVRLFVFLGLFLGLLLYYRFASQLFIRMILACLSWGRRLVLFVNRLFQNLILRPILLLVALFLVPVRFLLAGVNSIVRGFGQAAKGFYNQRKAGAKRWYRFFSRLWKHKLKFFRKKK